MKNAIQITRSSAGGINGGGSLIKFLLLIIGVMLLLALAGCTAGAGDHPGATGKKTILYESKNGSRQAYLIEVDSIQYIVFDGANGVAICRHRNPHKNQ